MYYPAIKRTDTMDPLCEKYYSISPYAWCGNNTVNRVDPDGMALYFMRKNGKIIELDPLYKEAEVLLTVNNDGKFISIELKDGNLLLQLANGKEAGTTNIDDAFNLFKFAADNSTPEWSLKGYKQDKKSMGFLLTRGEDGEVASGHGKYNKEKLAFDLHSHPPGSDNIGPSGSIVDNGVTLQSFPMGHHDAYNMMTNLKRNINTQHYIYHVGTRNDTGKLIYYNLQTMTNKKTQNERGIVLTTVKTATLLRTNIINRIK